MRRQSNRPSLLDGEGLGVRVPLGMRLAWRRLRVRILALLALGAFLVGAAVLIVTSLSSGNEATRTAATTTSPATTAATQPPPKPAKPVFKTVPLAAAGAYDPFGDDHENDGEVGNATDGDRSTYWSTERYSTWFKEGVGLVLDAGRPARLATLRLETDTPGFAAEIRAGVRPEGPFARISRGLTVDAGTVFKLKVKTPVRYVLIWITRIGATPDAGGAVRINEVRATACERSCS